MGIPKRVRRYFQNSYSYPNAVRRRVRTSSCSLIILNQRKSPSATRVSKEIETEFRSSFFQKSRFFPKGRGVDDVSQRKKEARRVDVYETPKRTRVERLGRRGDQTDPVFESASRARGDVATHLERDRSK